MFIVEFSLLGLLVEDVYFRLSKKFVRFALLNFLCGSRIKKRSIYVKEGVMIKCTDGLLQKSWRF